jgi:uncharacterized Zn finger protein
MMCPQCGASRRVVEPNAFGGRDKLRSTLACGHVVVKPVVIFK